MGDAEYLWAFQKIVMPIAMEFAPDLVIGKSIHVFEELSMMFKAHLVSAGFDAAEGDELGECNVTPTGYAHMTAMLCTLAEGRVLVALEVRSRNDGTAGTGLSSVGGLQPRLHL